MECFPAFAAQFPVPALIEGPIPKFAMEPLPFRSALLRRRLAPAQAILMAIR